MKRCALFLLMCCSMTTICIAQSDNVLLLPGRDSSHGFGSAISYIGDLDGDGTNELLIGARHSDDSGMIAAGSATSSLPFMASFLKFTARLPATIWAPQSVHWVTSMATPSLTSRSVHQEFSLLGMAMPESILAPTGASFTTSPERAQTPRARWPASASRSPTPMTWTPMASTTSLLELPIHTQTPSR